MTAPRGARHWRPLMSVLYLSFIRFPSVPARQGRFHLLMRFRQIRIGAPRCAENKLSGKVAWPFLLTLPAMRRRQRATLVLAAL